MVDNILPRLQDGAISQVAVGIHERGGGQVRRKDEFLATNLLIGIIANPQSQKDGGGRGGRIDDVAAHADGEVEMRILHDYRLPTSKRKKGSTGQSTPKK